MDVQRRDRLSGLTPIGAFGTSQRLSFGGGHTARYYC